MKKERKTLKKILQGTGIFGIGLFGSLQNSNAQEMIINPFLPTNENGKELLEMKTRAQRDSLVQAERTADWCDASNVEYKEGVFDCTEYTKQALTNNNDWGEDINLYDGYKGEPIPDSLYAHKGTLKDMGKNGLPYFQALIKIPGEKDHDQLTILTGDEVDGDITKWENWNFVEPQNDSTNVKIGEQNIPKNCEVIINHTYVKGNEIQGKYLASIPIIKFQITNGNPEFSWMNDDSNIKIFADRSIGTDTEFEKLNIYSPKQDTSVNQEGNVLEFEFEDKNLDLEKCYYELNGERNYFSNSSGSINLNSLEGLNELEIKVFDKAGNSKEDKINYYYEPLTDSRNDFQENSENVFYPNPVSTKGKLKHKIGEEVVVNIYNSAGQLVGNVQDNDKNGEVDFDFSKYKPGVYFYQTSSGKSGKILKK